MPLDLKENVALAPFTTLKIGGPARLFCQAANEADVAEAMAFANREGLAVFVLGGGSNILVSDHGFDGLVLNIGIKGVSESDAFGRLNAPIDERGKTAEAVTLTVGAGEDWDEFVARCVDAGLAGVECMSGIPGLVGGTPVQNVGAYGQEVSETIRSVRCFDRASGDVVDLHNSDCGFAYRTSIFNTTERDRYIVLSVTFGLTPGGEPKVVYRDLANFFGDAKPSLREVRDTVIGIRKKKSMVIDASDPNSRSAGSFFKNPIVGAAILERLKAEMDDVPFFEFGDEFKVPAAWLIEKAGFPKGFVHGNAGISSKHTLAIINRGEARASDIISLKDLIQNTVEAKFGIRLQPEPVFVGFG